MPTRGDQTDTRDWGSWSGKTSPLAALAPGEPIPAEPKAPVYTVTFLDLAQRGYTARTHVQLDCEPLVWTKMEPSASGFTKRTWMREYGDAGAVYREIAQAPFVPTAYKPGGGLKQSQQRGRAAPDVEPVEAEEWA
jgi:hypothetical protein